MTFIIIINLILIILSFTTLTREGHFHTSGELTQHPINRLISRVVRSRSRGHLGLHVSRVGRHGDLQLYVLSSHLLAEVGNEFDVDLQGGSRDLLIDGQNTERQVDVLRDTVFHQLELAIWRNEGNRTILIEATQTHATMEGAIIDFDSGSLATTTTLCLLLVGDEQLVVETETALGHTGQVGFHHDLTDDLTAQDSTGLGNEQVDALQCIDEDLVLTVGDTLTTPIDSSSDLRGNGTLVLSGLLGSLSQTNEGFHQRNIRVLGVAVIQNL